MSELHINVISHYFSLKATRMTKQALHDVVVLRKSELQNVFKLLLLYTFYVFDTDLLAHVPEALYFNPSRDIDHVPVITARLVKKYLIKTRGEFGHSVNITFATINQSARLKSLNYNLNVKHLLNNQGNEEIKKSFHQA